MDPSRKRTIRFVVALSAALLLATALAYTSFSASSEARQPSELVNASATPGKKGNLPDPFRAEREVVIDVVKKGDVYEGQTGTLVTKCPSKFTADKTQT